MSEFKLQAGDVVIDLSRGALLPTMAVVNNISTSWFRRKRPYLLTRTHNIGMVDKMEMWTTQSVIDETLKHPKVVVMRDRVQVWPEVKA